MKILIILLFYLYCIVFLFCGDLDESPPDLCNEDEPFRTNDRRCHSFSNLCFKTGNDQCNQLLNACKQCPPSHFTIEMLRDIRNMSKYQSNLIQQIIDKKIPNIFEQFSSTQKSKTNKSNESPPKLSNDSCAILLVIIIIILFVHFMETRFELFTKCFEKFIKKNNAQYSLVKSRKRKYQKDMFNKISELELKINQVLVKIDCLQTPSKDIEFTTISFQFECIDQELMKLYVHNNHNIVQVKQQICAKLPHANHDDYKIMKLKYNGIILNDDNQYLLKNIDKSNAIVNCFIDSSMNASDIVVVKLHGKMGLPDIIQINKNQSIDQLKEMIGKFISANDFSLFKQTNVSTKTEELKDNLNNLKDGDWIRIVTKEFGNLIMRSMFGDKNSITIEFTNVDLVSSLMKSISNKLYWDLKKFVLFYNNKCLEAEKYIFEYQISSESAVKYCCFMKIEGLDKQERCETDFNWELYRATKPPTNMEILLKKYKNINPENWKSQDWMMNELKTFLLTENHERFIQLFGVYFDDSLYVAMENMEKGTLKNFLQKNENFERKLICKWSEQILEGLEYLHDRKVVHRDLNPSNILVNINNDLKLSSFNLSKYENIYGPASFIKNDELIKVLKVRYMAPELLSGGEYKFQCDIWSFGTVLVKIASGKKPLPRLSKEEAKLLIIKDGIIDYLLSDKYKSCTNLKSLIDSCLIKNPDERCTIEKLKEIKNLIPD